jgi:hypothetical protein
LISFRYHIVSIVGVFLALALGILLGSSVVREPVQAQLNRDLEQRVAQRDEARAEAAQARADSAALSKRISDEIAPWAEHGRLVGTPVVTVVDGEQTPSWREHVLDALVAAGAQTQGSIVLSDRFRLAASGDAEEVVATVLGVVPTFEG